MKIGFDKSDQVNNILKKLSGIDYDNGVLEETAATADNAILAIAKLLIILLDKKILDQKQINCIIDQCTKDPYAEWNEQ